MRKIAFFLAILLLPCLLWAQEQGNCPYRLSAVDKSNFEKGVKAYEEKHYTEANSLLRKVSAKNPKASDPLFYLGMIAAKQDENPGAIRRYFTKLHDICPEYPDALAHYYMAVIYYTDNDFDAAVTELNKYFDLINQTWTNEWASVYDEASNYLYWSQFLAESYRNQVPFSPTLVRGASSKSDEILPYVTLDGKEIYYLRKVSLDNTPTFYGKELDKKVFRLFVSRWRDSLFTSGEALPAPFNLHDDEGGVTMTADKRLLFYSAVEHRQGYNNYDICFSENIGGIWQDVKPLGNNVNSEKSWESQPSVTPDGQYLYFASNRQGGAGGTDIWVCHRLPNGDWSRATNLGSSVNTAGNEKAPFICADGHTLFFASDGWQGFGGYDMYFIDLNDLYMQRPTNLGLPINTEKNDICFGVMAEGKRAYFSGKSVDFPGIGGSDIFWFDLYPNARPEAMKICQGNLLGENGKPLAGQIAVRRKGCEPAIYPVSADGSFTIMISAEQDNLLCALAEDYFPQTWTIDRYGKGTQTKKLTLSPLRKGNPYPIQTDQESLDIYADFLIEHPLMHVKIVAASQQERQTIAKHFQERGLRAERLDIQASGVKQTTMTLTQM